MARRPTYAELDILIIRFVNGEIPISEIEKRWQCKTARAYQLVNSLAQRLTGNYRCRDGPLLARLLARQEMRRRDPHPRSRFHPDTPEGFCVREINHRALDSEDYRDQHYLV